MTRVRSIKHIIIYIICWGTVGMVYVWKRYHTIPWITVVVGMFISGCALFGVCQPSIYLGRTLPTSTLFAECGPIPMPAHSPHLFITILALTYAQVVLAVH